MSKHNFSFTLCALCLNAIQISAQHFSPPLVLESNYGEVNRFEVLDLNQDGFNDILTNTLTWHPNPLSDLNLPQRIAPFAKTFTLAKLNDDPYLDLVFYRNTSLIWKAGTEDPLEFGEDQFIGDLSGVRAITIADLDGDGQLDVLTSIALSKSLFWFKADWNSQNFELREISLGHPYASFLTTDIDQDQDIDIVMRGHGNIYLLENNQSANILAAPQKIETPGQNDANAFQIADVNQDLYPEILIATEDDGLLLYDNEKGSIKAIGEMIDPREYYSLNLADLDQDGDLDMVGLAQSSSSILKEVFYAFENQDGLGTFANRLYLYEGEHLAEQWFLADMDNNGLLDIVGNRNNRLWVLDNFGWTGKSSSTVVPVYQSGDAVHRFVYRDMDGDTDPELLLETDKEVLILKNSSNTAEKAFYVHQRISRVIYSGHYWTASFNELADLDGDGDLDLMLDSGKNLYWCEYLEDKGIFNAIKPVLEREGRKYYFADWNEDGLIDIINVGAAGAVHILLNQGAMKFTEQLALDAVYNPGNLLFYEIGDVDADGDLDILFGINESGGRKLKWFRRDGDTLNLVTTDCVTNIGFSNQVIDYDQDGDLDVLYIVLGEPYLKLIRFDQQQGCFLPPEILYDQAPTDAQVLQAQDIDQDGSIEIIGTRYRKAPHPILIWKQNDQGFTQYELTSNDASPSQILFQDFNQDQVLDFMYLTEQVYHQDNTANKKLYLHYNQEDVFSPAPVAYPGPPIKLSQQQWVDLDGDGDRDLLAFNEFQLVWFPNLDGEGLLAQATPLVPGEFEKGAYTYRIQVFDYDQDQDLDIAILRTRGSTDFFLLLNDNARFTPHLVYNWPLIDAVTTSTLRDINLDGKSDFMLMAQDRDSSKQELLLLVNNGESGSFFDSPQVGVTSSTSATRIFEGLIDLDQDGDFDLLGREQNYQLVWFEQVNGNWQFTEPKPILENYITETSLLISDLDGDGFGDLVTCTEYNGTRQFVWFPNSEEGLFGDPQLIYQNCELETRAVDFDGDGDQDIVARGILYQNVDGKGGHFKRILLGSNNQNGYVQSIVDINGDGAQEIVSQSHFRLGMPGQLNFSNYHLYNNSGLYFRPTIVTDFNMDGDQDFIFESGRGVYWLRGEMKNENEISSEEIRFLFTKNQNNHVQYYVTDLNLDGLPDLVVTSPTTQILWYPGKGEAGNIGPPIKIGPIGNSSANNAINVKIADLNQDGFLDLLTYSNHLNQFRWYRHLDGKGRFDAPQVIAKLKSNTFRLADMDQNGTLDLVFAEKTMSWLANDGTGNFAEPLMILQADEIKAFQILDLNQDDYLDIVYLDEEAGEIALVFQKAVTGSFGEKIKLTAAGEHTSFWIVDINTDFLPDIAVQNTHDINWMRGLGNGQFSPISKLFEHPLLYNTLWQDLDQDQDVDIIFSDDPEKIFWRKNLSNNPLIRAAYYWDENFNALKDSNEIVLKNLPVQLDPNSITSFSDSSGWTNFYVSPGIYTIAYLPDSFWELTSDSSFSITAQNETIEERFFGLVPKVDTSHVDIHIAYGPTRCNTNVPIWYTFRNSGIPIKEGHISITLDALTDVDSIVPTPHTQIGDTLIWQINNWLPTETYEVQLFLDMPSENFTGEFIEFKAKALILDNDMVFEHTDAAAIRCSFDPNDKLVSPERGGPNYALFDELITYTVRFQNTGNDTAFNITITDQLDQKLDWSTFRPVAASHPYEGSISEGGLLTFRFRDILLPDSTTNEPGSHGFIQYTIKAKEWDPEYEVIENTAYIYFDYNRPIITNTTQNTLVRTLPITTVKNDEPHQISVKVYPNPFGEDLVIDLLNYQASSPLKFSLFDALGHEVFAERINRKISKLSIGELPTGMFYYQITNSTNNRIISMGKLVHVK